MALEEAGISLIAQGADVYVGDLKSAASATNGFVDTTSAGSGKINAAGEVMVGALRKVGEVAVNAFGMALQAGASFLSGGIADAREANQLLAQTSAVITSTGGAAERSTGQITDLATALSASQGASLFGDSQVQEAENLLLTFTNIKGAVFDATTAIAVDMAQALGGAPKDQAIALGKALNDPIQGVTALTRVGVTFTDEQKEQIKTMQEAGDMAGAQQIILAELNKEFGGSAKAAAAADGGMAKFNDSLGEIGESIGAAVLPLLNDLADWLNSPDVQVGLQAIADGAIVAFGWMHDNIPPIIDLVRSAVGDGITFITDIFNNDLQPALQDNQAFFQTTFNSISEIVTDVSQIVQIALAGVAAFIDEHGATIDRILSNSWESIKAVIDIALALIQGTVKTVLQVLQGDWGGAWETIKGMSARIVEDLGTIISAGLDNLLGIFQDLTGNVQKSWSQMVDDALDAGANLVAGIKEGVQNAWGGFVDWIIDLATGLIDEFLEAWGIKSPAEEWKPAGEFAVKGIMQGFADWWPSLVDQVTDLGKDLVKQVTDIGAAIGDAIGDGFGATASIDRQMAANLAKFKDVLPEYQSATQGMLKEAEQKARAILDPTEGAKFFKMRSDQILEYAGLQAKLADAENDRADAANMQAAAAAKLDDLRAQLAAAADDDERQAIQKQIEATNKLANEQLLARQQAQQTVAMLQQQMLLVNQAQSAEISQFEANARSSQNATESLLKAIADLQVAFTDFDLNDAQIALLGNLQGYMDQIVGAGNARADAYAHPPMMQYPAPSTNYYGNTYNNSMPIYTNNTPGAMQQSWAVMQASMP